MTKPKDKSQPSAKAPGPGTVNENIPVAPDAPATDTTTPTDTTNRPRSAAAPKSPLRPTPQRRRVGAPHREPAGKIEPPQATQAQLAAGPTRPEPATPVVVDPGGGLPRDADVDAFLDAPIKWLRVRATRTGFTGVGATGVRRRAGDVFNIDERFYSASWMEVVPASTPEVQRTGQDIIDEEHRTRTGRAPAKPTGDLGVLEEPPLPPVV